MVNERLPWIAGVGARTAVGRTMPSSAAAVRAGIARFVEHPSALDKKNRPVVVAMADWLPLDVAGIPRFVLLAVNAAKEALASVVRGVGEGTLARDLPINAVIALPEERPGRPEGLDEGIAAEVGEALRRFGMKPNVVTRARGSAAGFSAMEELVRAIRAGGAPLCLVGGVDSYVNDDALDWLDETGQLHSISNRFGFVPGEGAGFCLLASQELRERLRLPALGCVLEVATAREANRMKTETVCTGEGLSEALRGALAALPSGKTVDQVIGDLNGEPYRADELGFSAVRVAKQLAEPGRFIAPAACWGDVGAASAPLFVGLAVEAARRGYARGPSSLLFAGSEGGDRGAALVYGEPAPRSSAE